MKSFAERTRINFHAQLDRLMRLKGWTQPQLAKALGCSERTVSKLFITPLDVSARYTEAVREMVVEEERRFYG